MGEKKDWFLRLLFSLVSWERGEGTRERGGGEREKRVLILYISICKKELETAVEAK